MKIALGVEYNGVRYCGWQTQASGCAVQDHLQTALSKIAEHAVQVVCAGRTDSGVHAIEQVVHFETNVTRPLSAWVRGTNANLPNDIVALWAHPVGEGFHARFSAKSRRYRYVLLNRSQRPALNAGRVGWYHQPLDVDAMQRAAQGFVGRRDFSAFRSAECQAKSPVKSVHSFTVERRNDCVVFDIHADGFLHHMVRNLVGSLVYVGSARGDADWVVGLLESRDRRLAPPTFAPDGLYLTQIEYDAGWLLPQRNMSESHELIGALTL